MRQTPTQGSRIYDLCLAYFLTGLLTLFFHWFCTRCYHKHVILNSCFQSRRGCGDIADGQPQGSGFFFFFFNNNNLPQKVTVDFHFERWAWNVSHLSGIWPYPYCNESFLHQNWKCLKEAILALLHNREAAVISTVPKMLPFLFQQLSDQSSKKVNNHIRLCQCGSQNTNLQSVMTSVGVA